MSEKSADLAWRLFTELRKEIVDGQKIRAQAIGFKITFVSAVTGIIVTNRKDLADALLVIPAFAAIFFDFLITSYSFTIKRIGYYTREHLEPQLRQPFEVPKEMLLWEEFMSTRKARQVLSIAGNLGLTLLVVAAACISLFRPYYPVMSPVALAILLGLTAVDARLHWVPWRFVDDAAEPAPPPAAPGDSSLRSE
ncbi:MAG TPA: hypothetical protein VF017_14050 [Thermoanaerobaculia bacterium]|nr:hypothetical protein [Thermoanaerobaculia bacterium]